MIICRSCGISVHHPSRMGARDMRDLRDVRERHERGVYVYVYV